MKRLTIIGILALISYHAFAWDKEPSAVLGIELGRPFPDLPACPSAIDSRGRYAPPQSLCVDGDYGSTIRLGGLPFSNMYVTGSVHLFDAKVESITLSVNHRDYTKMRDILVSRYDAPGDSSISEVTTLTGATLDSRTEGWNGKNVIITLIERAGRVDQTWVMFQHLELSAAKQKKTQNEIGDAASKL